MVLNDVGSVEIIDKDNEPVSFNKLKKGSKPSKKTSAALEQPVGNGVHNSLRSVSDREARAIRRSKFTDKNKYVEQPGGITDRSRRVQRYGSAGRQSRTLPRERVPETMWEIGILTGYRPVNQSWMFYVKSLFWVHNETGNIWTHLLSPVISAYIIYNFAQKIDMYNTPSAHGLLIYAASSFFMYVLSAMAHLLHSKSLTTHYLLYCFDYAGIGILGYGTGILAYYCSGTELFYTTTIGHLFPWFSIICSSGITIGNCYVRTYYPKGSIERKIVQCATCSINFVTSQIPIWFRYYEYLTQEHYSVTSPNHYHVISWLIFIANILSFALHLPEKIYPGQFDIWGHGHQWFHLGVTCGVSAFLYAGYTDVLTIPPEVLDMAQPDIADIWIKFSIAVIVNLFVIFMLCLLCYKNIIKKNV